MKIIETKFGNWSLETIVYMNILILYLKQLFLVILKGGFHEFLVYIFQHLVIFWFLCTV